MLNGKATQNQRKKESRNGNEEMGEQKLNIWINMFVVLLSTSIYCSIVAQIKRSILSKKKQVNKRARSGLFVEEYLQTRSNDCNLCISFRF